MKIPVFNGLENYNEYSESEMKERASSFSQEMRKRRTVRDFSEREVELEIIEKCIEAAASAPSGANLQPWHFVVVRDAEIKRQIRVAAEEEEREFYNKRATKEWLEALSLLGTDEHKPFLEKAPYLIAIFVQSYGVTENGSKVKHYYALESVGIATGILITAIHHCGLVCLTHTPSPMGFLNKILGRPNNERPFLLLVVGYPEVDSVVPKISKKSLQDICTIL
ncbi:MAG: nitroreductase family protein [Acidobacteria bacterium]|nr:nitroreductase family protein [Acidobacteriota bacterium]